MVMPIINMEKGIVNQSLKEFILDYFDQLAKCLPEEAIEQLKQECEIETSIVDYVKQVPEVIFLDFMNIAITLLERYIEVNNIKIEKYYVIKKVEN